MARATLDDRAQEARQYFYAYQFRAAYQIYSRLFSTLPFHVTPSQLTHIAFYARTLIELGRLSELKFYIPILETHYQKTGGAQLAYALGFVHDVVGSKKASHPLFEYARDNAKEDTDLRIKATMMLARLAVSQSDSVHLIHSISTPAKDPQLAKLLEIWRAIVMRYQGDADGSIRKLRSLIEVTPLAGEEWYCLLSSKDALVRSYLHQKDFNSARLEIESVRKVVMSHKLRTAEMHMGQLNEFYTKCLGEQAIIRTEKNHATQLAFGGQQVWIRKEPLRRLVGLFQHQPTVTVNRLTSVLSFGEDQLNLLFDQLLEKLGQLGLPADSLNRLGSRVQFVPALRSEKILGGYPE